MLAPILRHPVRRSKLKCTRYDKLLGMWKVLKCRKMYLRYSKRTHGRKQIKDRPNQIRKSKSTVGIKLNNKAHCKITPNCCLTWSLWTADKRHSWSTSKVSAKKHLGYLFITQSNVGQHGTLAPCPGMNAPSFFHDSLMCMTQMSSGGSSLSENGF